MKVRVSVPQTVIFQFPLLDSEVNETNVVSLAAYIFQFPLLDSRVKEFPREFFDMTNFQFPLLDSNEKKKLSN